MHSTSILFNVSKSAVSVMTPWSVINGKDPEPYLSNHTVAFWSQILNTGVETRAFLLLEIFPSRAWGERGFEGSFGSCCLHRCQTKLLAGSCCSTFVGFFSPFLWAVSWLVHRSPLVCASSWWFYVMKVVPYMERLNPEYARVCFVYSCILSSIWAQGWVWLI